MEFHPGETVVVPDGQVGTVLKPGSPGRGYLEYTYPNPRSRGNKPVKAHPVLLDGGEIRVFADWALRHPGALSVGE